MNAKNSWFEQNNLRVFLLFSVACLFIYLYIYTCIYNYPALENPALTRYLPGEGLDKKVGQRPETIKEGDNRERRSRGYTNQRGRPGGQHGDNRERRSRG